MTDQQQRSMAARLAEDSNVFDFDRALEFVKHRPAEAFDFSYIGKDHENKVTDQARCDADPVLKYYSSPRQVAGGPLAEDILKCQLKPLKRSDYPQSFSDSQWTRMQKTFASGICDWSQRGIGMRDSIPWQTFIDGPGGKPLPAPPRSRPL